MPICIRATGLFTPPQSISNDELIESYNRYVEQYNTTFAEQIAADMIPALKPSSAAFIEKVSGIKSRYVVDKAGILDINRMYPQISRRDINTISLQAEMGVKACQDALTKAGCTADEVDAVILACSNMQRAYPAVAVEIQQALGMTHGFAFDMNVACSAATFGIAQAIGNIKAGLARRVLVVSSEITSAHLNWRSRDSHFIFGDVATAVLVEDSDQPQHDDCQGYDIIDSHLYTQFSNNIRNNFGFINRLEDRKPAAPIDAPEDDRLFRQNGRSVFKEVSPTVAKIIAAQLTEHGLEPQQVKRYWLHQANANMNRLILKSILGEVADQSTAPIILDEYANTSSAGSIIAFNQHQQDMQAGDYGIICSFGAGYSIGSILLQKR